MTEIASPPAHRVGAAISAAEGKLNDEQALAIITGVDAIPDDLDADLLVRAET
jgi:hypothetical protein